MWTFERKSLALGGEWNNRKLLDGRIYLAKGVIKMCVCAEGYPSGAPLECTGTHHAQS